VRRSLAAAVLGISLWLGSLAWSGFILTRTVLDPERSREVADALYDDELVRAQLVENIADGVEAALPDGVPVERTTIETAAAQALDSPAVEAVFVDAFVETHQAFLGEGDAPDSVDPGAFGAAARESLVASRPELDGVLPAAPQLAIPLPTERVPNLGPVRDGLLTVVPLLAAVSALGAALALLVTSNRPAILRRAGVWAASLAALVLAFAYGIPALGERFAPDQSAIIAALIGAMAASTRGPALALGAVGLGAVAMSLVWKAAPALAPARAPRVRRRREPVLRGGTSTAAARVPRRAIPIPRRGLSAAGAGATPSRPRPPDGYGHGSRAATPPPGPRPRSFDSNPTRVGASPQPDPTLVERAVAPDPEPGAASARRWVEGVGWVIEPTSGSIPAEARWVAGVGYVVDS